ncbi:MAG: HTH-type transcriptional regulator/antitoxin HigA [Pseudomonas sp.]|jgi:HTH-type transcriptional regulator/antitoxin HigA
MLECNSAKLAISGPPGNTISDAMEEKCISNEILAGRMNVSVEFISLLIRGHQKITEEVASKLSAILGASTSFWLNREKLYRDSLDFISAGISEEEGEWLSQLPVSKMQSLNWIVKTKLPALNLINCLNFFNVPNVSSWKELYQSTPELASFRTSQSFTPDLGAVAAWVRMGELEANFIDCLPWDLQGFKQALFDIKILTNEKNPDIFVPKLQQICAGYGVAVVIERAPAGCQASGATKFIEQDKALLLLSLRYLSDDHFWFTFFHEAGHLILHGRDGVFVENDRSSSDIRESEANEFSRKFLIPDEYVQELVTIGDDMRKIIRFSRKLGISPGIVVGQLQFRGVIKQHHMQKLKVRYTWG